jgi:HSP20 family protein
MSDTNVTKSSSNAPRGQGYITPSVDVVEEAGGITLYADLPGVPKDKLALQVEADVLTIDAEVVLTVPQELKAIHTEVSAPRFRRAFALSKELDVEKVSAEFQQGVLKLHIPKAAQAQPKKINVNVH